MATATALEPEPLALDQYEVGQSVTLWQDAWRRLRRNRFALLGLIIVLLVIAMGLVSIFYTPYPVWKQAIGPTFEGPSVRHPLGLDSSGRDLLSRMMGGALISIEVGIGTAVLSSLIGIVLGLLAGFYRGTVDWGVSMLINIAYGVPDLLVAMLMVVLIGRGLHNIIIAISVTAWLGMARLVRGVTLSLREREFVEAARAVGTHNRWILMRHLLPNALGPIIVQATFLIPAAIIFEAFLSFLGLGVAPPTPSWGAMAADGYRSIQLAPHTILVPALALSITVMAFNFLGDGLRDALDPRMRR